MSEKVSQEMVCLLLIGTVLAGGLNLSNWVFFPTEAGLFSGLYIPTLLPMTQSSAKTHCATNYAGRLAVMATADQNNWVVNRTVAIYSANIQRWGSWIGLEQLPNSTEPKGGWCWINGVCLNDTAHGGFTDWGLTHDEPNNSQAGSNCTAIQGVDRKWNDVSCTSSLYPVCEVQNCPPGHFLQPRDSASYYCTKCPSAKYQNRRNRFECNPCEFGSTSDEGSDVCEPCREGSFINDIGFCELCPAGKGSERLAFECSICTPGKYAREGTGCISCPVGKFSSGYQSEDCLKCDIDGFNSTEFLSVGSVTEEDCSRCIIGYDFLEIEKKCVPCEVGKYGENDGCKGCPSGRYGESVGSTSVLQCLNCKEGRWSNVTGLSGISNDAETCQPCPVIDGVSCPEGSSIPFVDEGLYRDPNDVVKIEECVPELACSETGFSLETPCFTGYEGYLCSTCSKGHYRKDRDCLKCSIQWLKWVIFGIFVVLGGLIVFFTSNPTAKFAAKIRVTLLGMQLLSILPRITEGFAPYVLRFLRIISITNFDIQFFSFQCSVQYNYWTAWVLKLLIPYILLGALLVCYLIGKALRRRMRRQTDYPYHQFVYCFISIFQFVYLYLVLTSFEPWQCKRKSTEDNSYVMFADPRESCFTTKWNTYVYLIGIPLSFVSLIVIPSVLVFFFVKYRSLREEFWFQSIFGALTRPYRSEVYWYEAVVTGKKLAVVILPDILSSWISGNVRVLISVIVFVLFLTVDSSFMPYNEFAWNRVNVMFTCVVIFVLMSSFVTSKDSTATAVERQLISTLSIAFAIFVLLLSAYLIIHSLHQRFRSRLRKTMKNSSMAVSARAKESTRIVWEE